MNIRQLNKNDLPEVIRLVVENTTLHTRLVNPITQYEILIKCVEELVLEKENSFYYGEFDELNRLLSWRRLLFWNNTIENCCTLGLSFTTNSIELEKIDGSSKTLSNLMTYVKKVIEDKNVNMIYVVKPHIKEWKSSSYYSKGYTVTNEEVIEPGELSKNDLFNKYILTFRTQTPRLIYSMKKPL